MRASLKVSGMSCVNCARAIEISLKKLRGIQEVQVSFELGRVVVEYREDFLDVEQIKRVIESLGYKVEAVEEKRWKAYVLLFCWVSSLSIMFFMFWHGVYSVYIQAFLALMVQVFGGYDFYKGSFGALRSKVGNMDLLIALGSSSALLYSFLSLFGLLPGEPFFETSAFLITFVRTGRFLEDWVKARALKGFRDLFSLQTIKVKVLKGGKEISKSLQEVFVGDLILLRTGDMVPVDCSILEGNLEVDESLITGESLPVKKSQGDRILSGSLVISGFAKAKVEKTFSHSYANLLVRLVEESLSKKPRIHRLADKVSHYFVQVVVLLSFMVFLFWYIKTGNLPLAVSFSLALMVVSCPCAFGIAVPLALTYGILKANKRGVLVKDPTAFEKDIDVLLVDKTGTLTEGKPRLVGYKLYEEEALNIACSMAKVSNHPYSVAIKEFCESKGIKGEKLNVCREEAGFGVLCGEYVLGRGNEGQVALVKKGSILAEFFFEDVLREDALEVVSFLRSKGIRVFMLTGDREEKARQLAQGLGIDYIAQAKPEDKLKKVEELKQKGLRVGMVGDGINDAPAMARADLSFAIGSGTDMAKRAGDVILLEGIRGVKTFFEIRGRTLRRIKENLFWAFIYNLLGIPIAGGLLYSKGIYLKPEIAGLMMAFSSLSVVLNSVRK
ncbi:MAG: heavy metal translocating P-type ATPase [Aquificaceae bacterium]